MVKEWQLPQDPRCSSAESRLWLQITFYCITFWQTGPSWPFLGPHPPSCPDSDLNLFFSHSLSDRSVSPLHPFLSHPLGTYQSNDFSSSYCRRVAWRRRKVSQKLVVSIPDALSEIIRTFISIREQESILLPAWARVSVIGVWSLRCSPPVTLCSRKAWCLRYRFFPELIKLTRKQLLLLVLSFGN